MFIQKRAFNIVTKSYSNAGFPCYLYEFLVPIDFESEEWNLELQIQVHKSQAATRVFNVHLLHA